MGDVKKFIPKAEIVATEKADEARQLILDLGLPSAATEAVLLALARYENGGLLADWRFVMLSPAQCLAVWDAIRELPADDRPNQVRHLFDLVITHLETNTGAVVLTRDELAEKVGTEPRHISTMMGTLERMGVIYRRRIKQPGMRGRGIARYYVNPHVAWHGKLEVRKEQSRDVPLPFAVIEGGAAP